MVRVPTIAEEDAKRPNRERESLVGERTRINNRIKATLARLGIRNFKPTLRQAAERLATVHTPEGMPLPPNVLAELQRDMARLGLMIGQIRSSANPKSRNTRARCWGSLARYSGTHDPLGVHPTAVARGNRSTCTRICCATNRMSTTRQ
jgi:hypothetical protein